MRGAIPVRRLQLVAHVAAFGQRQSWLGDCWAGYVAADAIQLFALVRLSRYGGVQARLQLIVGGRVDLFERQLVRLVADVNAIKEQHMEMDIQVKRRAKTLDEGDGSGMGCVVRLASGEHHVGGNRAIDNAKCFAHHFWFTGKQEA